MALIGRTSRIHVITSQSRTLREYGPRRPELARRLRRSVRLFAVLPSLAACRPASPPGQAPPPAAPSPEAYVSNLTGVAFGNAFARATTDGAPSTDNRSSGGDQPVDASARADGEELKRTCRSKGTQSHAQATAAFAPLAVDGVRQFGFALSTTTYAKGGIWRGPILLCNQSHTTVAAADATATGRLDLTFNATGDASEPLILRVSGATPAEAHLEVRDGDNQLLPLSLGPGGTSVATTLARPGPYSVQASLASHALDGGGGNAHDQQEMTFSVSVQSMRDALALGYGRGPANVMMLPLPVFMSADAMSAALDSALFTDQHRLYPCAKVNCGTERLRDVYLETPHVSTSDGSVVLDMHLAGSYQFALIFGSGVSGTIRATAVPVVEHDTLRFDAPSIDVATRNVLVKWRSASFEQKLLDRIRKVRIDLTPRLQAAVARAQEHLPVAWGGACLLVAPTDAHVRSVQVVTTAPQGILANFGIELSGASADACAKAKATH